MKYRSRTLKILILAFCMAGMPMVGTYVFAQSESGTTTTKVHGNHARRKAKTSTIESQIQEMRQMFQQQQKEIDELKQQLQSRDQQLQQAQDAARQAQSQAQSAFENNTQNTAAYTDLKQAVQGIQAETHQSKQTVSMVEQDQKQLKKTVLHPDEIYYKGITISPNGSFIEAATVYRSGATGGGINTALTGIPLDNSNAAQLSEFYGSGRQSRIALKATGNLDNMTLTGYYEMDWLGTGITSNNNQSNSYVVRQRQLWARAALNNGWSFTGGQMWSLATETAQSENAGTETLPPTIDPQYTAGFVWARQYGFRVTKEFGHEFTLGASAENAETLNPAGSGLPTNLLIGSAGVGGGQFNSTANYSFNLAPDFIAKATFDPAGWGHYELFGIARFFRDRVYPPSGNPYNDSTVGGGVGGGFRIPVLDKKVTVGLKGLYGNGVGRYGDSEIADVTLHPDAQIAPLHGFSALATLEYNPTRRLNLWSNYGGDYIGRRYYGSQGYGSPLTNMTGCDVEPKPGGSFSPSTPTNCSGNNKDVQELSVGYWFNFYAGSRGKIRQGIQYSRFQRDLWSGVGGGAQGVDNGFWTSFRYYLP